MKYLTGLALMIVLLAFVVGILVFQSKLTDRNSLTSEVQAQIIEMSPRKTIDPETGQTNRVLNVLVTYRYFIEEKMFEKRTTLSKSESSAFQIGQPAKICFDPNRPEQGELFSPEHQCGN